MQRYIESMKKTGRKYFIISLLLTPIGVVYAAVVAASEDKVGTAIDFAPGGLFGLLGILGIVVFGIFTNYRMFRKEIKSIGDYDTIISELSGAPVTEHGTFGTIITDELFAFLTEDNCRVIRKADILSSEILDNGNGINVSAALRKPNGRTENAFMNAGSNEKAQVLNDIINGIINETNEKENTP